jgi:hypothetical protein
MNTSFVQLHFTLAPPAQRLSPWALFAIRQQFHTAFRRAAGCLHDQKDCRVGSDCPCQAVFGQELATDPAALRLYQKPPLPFAFKIPVLSEKPDDGHEVALSLVIVGAAIRHLDLFAKATLNMFESSGELSPWRILRVSAACPDGSRTEIPIPFEVGEFASLPILSFAESIAGVVGSSSRVAMHLQTPLRLVHNGAPAHDLPFSVVAGALFRRISALAYYYGGEELPHDFKWLAMQSQQISCERAELRWVDHGGPLQGLEGELLFSGELMEFIPFLQLGSLLNIGKGASYGMGSYRLT